MGGEVSKDEYDDYDNFYYKEVCISTERMERAEEVVQEIEAKLKTPLIEKLDQNYKVILSQTWEHFGSAYEGLKVRDPDEFDILLPITVQYHVPTVESVKEVAEFFGSLFTQSSFPKLTYEHLPSADRKSPFAVERFGDYVLHSQKVMSVFHRVLQKAVDSLDFSNKRVWIGQDGSAMTVFTEYSDYDDTSATLKINLIPAITYHRSYYVANTEDSSGKWRVTFPSQEMCKVEFIGENKKKVLKIAKIFCKKDTPLAAFDSYFLKNIFYHMLDKYPEEWTKTNEYFMKFLEELHHFLRRGSLPMYYLRNHNMIEHPSHHRVDVRNIMTHIERLLSDEYSIIEIMRRPIPPKTAEPHLASFGVLDGQLQVSLEKFYMRMVDIPQYRMDDAKRIVETVKERLEAPLRRWLEREHITLDPDWVYTGSAYEGLKVCHADEFDIMLPFDMTEHFTGIGRFTQTLGAFADNLESTVSLFSQTEPESVTDVYDFLDSAEESSKFSSKISGTYVLDSDKVMRMFQSVLKKAANEAEFGDMEIRIGKDGPSGKVDVYSRTSHHLKIDLVPAVKNRARYYVAKSDKHDTSPGAEAKWRVSYSDEEKRIVSLAGEDKRQVLKLAKAFCKEHPPLAGIESYYLKTVFLHMLDDYPGDWVDTSEYLKEFLSELLSYLNNKTLPMYHMQRHNLIGNFVESNPEYLTNIIGRLQSLVKRGDSGLITVLEEINDKCDGKNRKTPANFSYVR